MKKTVGKTKKLTVCAVLVALSAVLAFVSKLLPAPWLQGGSITIASAVPVIMASLLFGWKWGIISSLTYGILQLMTGFYPPPTKSIADFFLVVFLDYILAFGVYGIASVLYKKGKDFTIPLSGFVVVTLRYVCHIISGVLIWGVYAEEGQTVLAYSVLYNGSYMIPEIIITTVVLTAMIKFVRRYA